MITIKDIANAAGVSHATVSYVLNGRAKEQKISAAVCERVLKLAKEMGYLRNEVAHSFGTGTSNIIGVILPEVASEYSGRLLYGISTEAAGHGYIPKLFYRLQPFEKTVEQCVGQRVAGVISYDLSSTAIHRELHKGLTKYGIPLCIAAGISDQELGLRISSDLEGGCRQALQHVFRMGIRNTAILSEERGFYGWSQEMLNQFGKSARDCGMKAPVACTNVDELLAQPCQAVFCVSDFVAMHAIMKLRLAGRRIPEDIAVIGYGRLMLGEFAVPRITTIDEQLEELGKFAFRELLWKIRHPGEEERSFRFPMRLEIRESSMFKR
ncbi:MAG: LacI family DNA-binding transcriptional regulator [Victivallales bacterium]|nr:LacI family DNA-binding transcriptional regulator [Victivallales bacterium]